jgi:hypothetical protein
MAACTSRARDQIGRRSCRFLQSRYRHGCSSERRMWQARASKKADATQPNGPPSPHSSSNNTVASSNSAGTFRRYCEAVVERRGNRLLLMGDGWQCRNPPLSWYDAEFSPAIIELDAEMRAGRLRHNGNRLLTWCVGNVVRTADRRSNLYPTKTRLDQKTDPAVAVMMAVGHAMAEDQEQVGQSAFLSNPIAL